MPQLRTLTATLYYWTAEPTVGSESFTGPTEIPYEWQIALCNEVGCDGWFNIPLLATDDYVTQLATLIKNNLDSGLKAKFELSNEVWNFAFSQASIAGAYATNAFLGGGTNYNYDSVDNYYYYAARWYAQRCYQISSIVNGILGSQAQMILAWQNGASFIHAEYSMLNYLSDNYGAPSGYIYGVATGVYFNLPTEDDDNNGLTAAEIIADYESYNSETDTSANPPAGNIANIVTNAAYWGLQPMAYEGGFGFGTSNHLSANAEAEQNSAYTGITESLLNSWFDAGGGLFNYFTLGENVIQTYGSQYGDYNMTQDINVIDTPRQLGYIVVRSGT
jgi:hypothetical protein